MRVKVTLGLGSFACAPPTLLEHFSDDDNSQLYGTKFSTLSFNLQFDETYVTLHRALHQRRESHTYSEIRPNFANSAWPHSAHLRRQKYSSAGSWRHRWWKQIREGGHFFLQKKQTIFFKEKSVNFFRSHTVSVIQQLESTVIKSTKIPK